MGLLCVCCLLACVRSSVLNDYHKTWYEQYGIGGHHNTIVFMCVRTAAKRAVLVSYVCSNSVLNLWYGSDCSSVYFRGTVMMYDNGSWNTM
jgi:hypothetical protein